MFHWFPLKDIASLIAAGCWRFPVLALVDLPLLDWRSVCGLVEMLLASSSNLLKCAGTWFWMSELLEDESIALTWLRFICWKGALIGPAKGARRGFWDCSERAGLLKVALFAILLLSKLFIKTSCCSFWLLRPSIKLSFLVISSLSFRISER